MSTVTQCLKSMSQVSSEALVEPEVPPGAVAEPELSAVLLIELLELHDVREHVLEHVLGVGGGHRQVGRDAQDVGALGDEVVEVLVRALVRDLRQPGLLRAEGLVQVEQLQLRVR